MPAISSIATSRETIALNAAQALGADRHGDRQHRRQRDRDRGDGQDERELSGFQQRVVAEQRREPDDQDQADRHQDEEIADAQHGALEVRNRLGLLDEMRGLAEIGVHAGRGDDAGHLALLGDRAGIGVVADLLVDRQRFAGQRGLVDAEIGARDQLDVGGNDVAELDHARHRREPGASPRCPSIRRRA